MIADLPSSASMVELTEDGSNGSDSDAKSVSRKTASMIS